MKCAYKLPAAASILSLLAPTLIVLAETPPPAEEKPAVPAAILPPSHISAGHTAPQAGTLVNPYKDDKDMATAGVGLFASMNCDGCHGGGASGFAAPSLADGRWRYGDSDEEIFQSIYFGRPKGMPAFGGVLGADGIWILVTYLKSLPVTDNATQSWESNPVVPALAPAAQAAESTVAPAASADALFRKYACIACHAPTTKLVGPAFKDVAAKYRGDKGAEQFLFDKVRKGGSDVWGEVPMPPNAAVPDADLQAMVRSILAMK